MKKKDKPFWFVNLTKFVVLLIVLVIISLFGAVFSSYDVVFIIMRLFLMCISFFLMWGGRRILHSLDRERGRTLGPPPKNPELDDLDRQKHVEQGREKWEGNITVEKIKRENRKNPATQQLDDRNWALDMLWRFRKQEKEKWTLWQKIVTVVLVLLVIVVAILWLKVKRLEDAFHEIQEVLSSVLERIKNIEQDVEFLKKQVQKLDHRFDELQKTTDALYQESIKHNAWAKKVDEHILEFCTKFQSIFSFFKTQRESRIFFGLGCWPAGTMIQIDALGNCVPVEDIYKGSLVWNPEYGKQLPIKLSLSGEETGEILRFTTNGNFSVCVTETHPMKILDENQTKSTWQYVVAKDVKYGHWVETSDGIQKIERIEKIPVKNILVYNFEFDLEEELPMHYHSVVSNGIYTLDFFGQRQLNKA